MDRSIKIAENLTVGDWINIRERLEADMQNNKLWEEAITFFDKRLNSRYLQPIRAIEINSEVEGEGFSIVAIICSMIEMLESFYQGRAYRKPTKDNPLDENTEYYRGQPLFESFLKNREPFNNYFSENDLATEFYENVRCAILHEAATRNGWKIRIDTDKLVVKQEKQVILNRVLFVQEIEVYIAKYKKELMKNIDLKNAYIRKFNSICGSA